MAKHNTKPTAEVVRCPRCNRPQATKDVQMHPEEFRPIIEFQGYRVGTNGTVETNLTRTGFGEWGYGDSWHEVASKPMNNGYRKVNLWKCGQMHQRLVHRLVLEAFVGQCPDGMECAHENGIRSDCRLSNISWKTPIENAADRDRHGTTIRGTKHCFSRLNASICARIRSMHEKGLSNREISKAVGISKTTIGKVVRNETYC